MKAQTSSLIFYMILLVFFQGCATPYRPYGALSPAGRGNDWQQQYPAMNNNPEDPVQRAVIACQQQLGPPPSLGTQMGEALAGVLIGAAGNAAFNAIIGGDPGLGAALGASGGAALGVGSAVMQPGMYQEAFNQCVNQVIQHEQYQHEMGYINRPCTTQREGVRNNGGQWQTQDRYRCSERTYSPPYSGQ